MSQRRKPRYTEKVHARRLIQMLNRGGKVCRSCPAARGFSYTSSPGELWSYWSTDMKTALHQCKVCTSFLGAEFTSIINCPCSILGEELAVKKSWEALKEKGYV